MDEVLSEKSQHIREQIESLLKLQGLDDEINRRSRQIEEVNQKIKAENEAVLGFQESHQQAGRDVENYVKERRDAEVSAKDKQAQVQKLGGQLFEVKTNEAYNALQTEIRQHKQENSLLEERILEIMMAEDELKTKEKEIEDQLKQAQQHIAQVQTGLKTEITSLEGEIQNFQKEWDRAAEAVKASNLSLYQRLRAAKGGRAMAKIENDVCLGCRLSIRPQATIELKKYRSILFCDNCARILYAD